MEIIYQTIREFMQAIFGNYIPVTYTDSAGNSIIPAGVAGVDWQYVLGVVLFCIIVYSLLRIVGGLICRNY